MTPIYIEADEEILWAPDLDYAWGFIRDRYNKGARTFYLDTNAKPERGNK